jgi:hypothetical protein
MIRAVPFEAGGKDYKLRYTTNRLVALEAATGKEIIDWVASFAPDGDKPKMPSFTDMRTLFHAGIWPQVGIEDAGDLIDDIGLEKVGTLIGEAFSAAFEHSAQGAAGDAQNPRPAAAAAR